MVAEALAFVAVVGRVIRGSLSQSGGYRAKALSPSVGVVQLS